MKLSFILVLTLGFILLGCGPKKGRAELKFILGNTTSGPVLPGGVYVYGSKEIVDEETEIVTYSEYSKYDLDEEDKTVIPLGKWNLHFVGWAGPEKYHGTVYCNTINSLLLEKEELDVDLVLDQNKCSDNSIYLEMIKDKIPPIDECPEGYIPVLGSNTLGTSDFCVMKYEAKNGSGSPVSQAVGDPWGNITALEAFDSCAAVSVRGHYGKFALISNPEWMTVARDAESLVDNWSGSSVGTGVLARGWTAYASYGDSWSNITFAPTSNSSCLYNLLGDSCSSSGDLTYKRTHLLSNGEEIWDLGANIFEWADWDYSDDIFTLGPKTCQAGWQQFSTTCSDLNADDYLPIYSDNSSSGVGLWHGGVGGAAIRSGKWDYSYHVGIYAVLLLRGPTYKIPELGFRCVYRY